MPRASQGPIQVFDASVPSLNLAFAQVLERLDQARGLRGVVTISDSTAVGPPLLPDDAIRLRDLAGLLGLDQGSFTVTGTGFTTTITGTAQWLTIGAFVWLYLPTLTGTSNSVAFTLTGLPAALTPTLSSLGMALIQDNGFYTRGFIELTAGSPTITLRPSLPPAVWTAGGTKTFFNYWLGYALL